MPSYKPSTATRTARRATTAALPRRQPLRRRRRRRRRRPPPAPRRQPLQRSPLEAEWSSTGCLNGRSSTVWPASLRSTTRRLVGLWWPSISPPARRRQVYPPRRHHHHHHPPGHPRSTCQSGCFVSSGVLACMCVSPPESYRHFSVTHWYAHTSVHSSSSSLRLPFAHPALLSTEPNRLRARAANLRVVGGAPAEAYVLPRGGERERVGREVREGEERRR